MKTLQYFSMLSFLLLSCSNPPAPANNKTLHHDTILEVKNNKAAVVPDTAAFSIFHNAEMVEYCVPVPGAYHEAYPEDLQKGAHVFNLNSNKVYSINVQGLVRADTAVSLPQYYHNTYAGAAEEGKIITERQVLPDKNCFYAMGYWNNQYYSSRFLEITWLRTAELVTYKVSMQLTDTLFWNRHLQDIINTGALCR